MLVTKEWMAKNYIKFNQQFWDGKLPMVEFKISNSSTYFGLANYKYNLRDNTVTPISLTISNYYDSPEDYKINTLLHEMIHIADYSFNPHHFVWRGKLVSKREYNAHGPIFFLKEAQRLKPFGFDINPTVQQSELDQSVLSDKNKTRVKKKVDKGIQMLLLRLRPDGSVQQAKWGKYTYVIVNTTLHDWVHSLAMDKWFQTTYMCADLFVSHDEKFASLKSSKSGASKYCEMAPEEFIKKHDMTFVKNIYGKEYSLGKNITEENMKKFNNKEIDKIIDEVVDRIRKSASPLQNGPVTTRDENGIRIEKAIDDESGIVSIE